MLLSNKPLQFSGGRFEIFPITVTQSQPKSNASNAIDKNLDTRSQTTCGYNMDIWFKMKFSQVYCFEEVKVINGFIKTKAPRMKDTRIFVVDSSRSAEGLCGILVTVVKWSVQGQTYRLVTVVL